jgi:hypothetical protein
MLVTEDIPSKVYTSGDGGANWLLVNPSPAPSNQVYRAAYGNDYVVTISANTGNISVSNNLAGTGWSNATLSGINLYGVTFGSMSNGTKVFILYGTNNIRRNTGTTLSALSTVGNWSPPSTPPGDGGWQFGAFGNDTFMVTSGGTLTISRDGGDTWSAPISFGILLYFPIYVEGEWYIGSENGFIMISKNNGITWEKKVTGTDIYDFAYGNGLLVGVNYRSPTNNIYNLIGLKTKRDDGSLITSDSITIGREGSQTVVKGENFTAVLATTCTAVTQTQANNSTKIATTEYVDTGLGFKLNTIGSVSTFSCPILRADAATVSTTQFATVRYTPINSRCAYVSIQFLNISENVRGIRITTDQFPLLKGISPIPIFTIPVVSLRAGNGAAVDSGLTYQSVNLFLANRNQGIGWYNQQLGGNASDLTFHTSALPNSDGATSLFYTYIDCMQVCGIIGV